MWIRRVVFGRGWEGTLETALGPLEMQSTYYGDKPVVAGTEPTPRLRAAFDARASEVVTGLEASVDRTAVALAELWNEQWRGGRKATNAAALKKGLRLASLLFNGGEKSAQYMLLFEPAKLFDGYRPQLTVTRGEIDFLSLDPPRARNGDPLGPDGTNETYVYDQKKSHVSLRARPKIGKTKKKASVPPVAPVPLVWHGRGPKTDGKVWRGKLVIDGRRVAATVVSADADALPVRFLKLLPAVLDDAAARLAKLYDSSWSDLSRPPLDAAGVLRRVKLSAIELEGRSFTLTLSDGGLFGRHTIEVNGSGTKVRDVNLVG